MRFGAWTVAVVLAAMTACTSSAGSVSAGSVGAVSVSPPPSSQPSAPANTNTNTAAEPSPRAVAQQCLAAHADNAVAKCLVASLNAFWSTQLRRSVVGHVMLGFPDTFPASCRFPKEYYAIHARSAFECPANDTFYFGPVFLRHLHQDRPADAFPERLAAALAHEEGHLIQDTVHQRQPYTMSPEAGSRVIEQQADCLSGVWAHGVGLDTGDFLLAARVMLTDVDDAEHRRDHGTVGQRLAAMRRGLTGVAACHLPEH